jgi:hypothetical protein
MNRDGCHNERLELVYVFLLKLEEAVNAGAEKLGRDALLRMGQLMKLIRLIRNVPSLGLIPEPHVFVCPSCGEDEMKQVAVGHSRSRRPHFPANLGTFSRSDDCSGPSGCPLSLHLAPSPLRFRLVADELAEALNEVCDVGTRPRGLRLDSRSVARLECFNNSGAARERFAGRPAIQRITIPMRCGARKSN